MDPVSQGVVGAAFAEAFLFKFDRSRAWIVGAIAGMAADIDILFRMPNNPLFQIKYHRHFTHSLAFIPFGALLCALLFLLIPRFRNKWHLIFIAALIGYATHGLLDALTSYGTLLFWPFSNARISWDIMPIIQPLFTIILIIGVAWSVLMKQYRGVATALPLAFLIVFYYYLQHERILQKFHIYEKVRVMPGMLKWRAAYVKDDRLHYKILPHEKKAASFKLFSEEMLPKAIKQSPTLYEDFKVFNWFSDNFLIIASLDPLILVDGRYLISTNPATFIWGIEFDINAKHVKMLRMIKFARKK